MEYVLRSLSPEGSRLHPYAAAFSHGGSNHWRFAHFVL